MFYIMQKDWNRMVSYAKAAVKLYKSEIGGMAVLKRNENGDWQVVEPTILKQEVGGASCDLDKVELSKYCTRMFTRHGPNVRFLWWHSHALMQTFMSGTDITAMEEFMEKSDWGVFLVINALGEHKMELRFAEFADVIARPTLQIVGESYDVEEEVRQKCNERYSYAAYKHTKDSVWDPDKKMYLPAPKDTKFSKRNRKKGADIDADIAAGKRQIEAWNIIDSAAVKFISGIMDYKAFCNVIKNVNISYAAYVEYIVPEEKDIKSLVFMENGVPTTYNLVKAYVT